MSLAVSCSDLPDIDASSSDTAPNVYKGKFIFSIVAFLAHLTDAFLAKSRTLDVFLVTPPSQSLTIPWTSL